MLIENEWLSRSIKNCGKEFLPSHDQRNQRISSTPFRIAININDNLPEKLKSNQQV